MKKVPSSLRRLKIGKARRVRLLRVRRRSSPAWKESALSSSIPTSPQPDERGNGGATYFLPHTHEIRHTGSSKKSARRHSALLRRTDCPQQRLELHKSGILYKYAVEVLGTPVAIDLRGPPALRNHLRALGLKTRRACSARPRVGCRAPESIGYPVMLRAALRSAARVRHCRNERQLRARAKRPSPSRPRCSWRVARGLERRSTRSSETAPTTVTPSATGDIDPSASTPREQSCRPVADPTDDEYHR